MALLLLLLLMVLLLLLLLLQLLLMMMMLLLLLQLLLLMVLVVLLLLLLFLLLLLEQHAYVDILVHTTVYTFRSSRVYLQFSGSYRHNTISQTFPFTSFLIQHSLSIPIFEPVLSKPLTIFVIFKARN